MVQMYKFENIFYNIDVPQLLSTKIIQSDADMQLRMIACIEQQLTRNPNYHGGYTFEVKDPCNDFARLYNTFFHIVTQLFGPFNLSIKQRNYCWANVYNKDTYRSNLHHHLRTSSVNAIFYLNIPTDNEGGLRLLFEEQELIYMPDQLELLIMPSWMLHEPLPVTCEQNRIAINMEISTIEDVDTYFTQQRIFKHARPNI